MLFLFSFLFVFKSDTFAQGTYTCRWGSPAGGVCRINVDDCASGYERGRCTASSKAACSTSPRPCVKQGSPDAASTLPGSTGTCSGSGGVCATFCLQTYTNIGKLDCSTTQTCCAPKTTPTDGKLLCPGGARINTAIGCIPVEDTTAFITFFLSWAFGIGGGIAFLLIALASFQIMTSAGDPKKLQAGKELLTSAISGLLLLIFGVFILRVIGMDILGLGEFGFGNGQ